MTIYQGAAEYCHGTAPTTGVLLTNLGTPDAPTPAALRRYLAEFLWDPRVVEAPRWLWWLALHGVILRIRPARSAHAYQKIWTAQGSPLLANSRSQAEAVKQALQARFDGRVVVALGMRYGTPSIREALEQLRAAQVRRILVFPLYPQYSASTTASTFDAVSQVLKTWRWLPELRMINHYHDDTGYISAVANSIREAWRNRPPAERLMFSFHGLPKRYLLQGDPYHCECHKTARLIAEQLNLPEDRWQVAFQSRFGREEWLKPYADHTLQEWAKAGVKSADVVCPGFSADCLETLEEVAMQNRDIFLNAGGESYHYIPALNDHPEHIKALVHLIELHTQGWPELNANADQQSRDAEMSKRRALDLGAKQ
ncbi:MAG TPA: ferrochelatase [Gammaproteobacteria bacterium]|nr:ferrochelatase [Gammaproteobacteria bacterium]